MSILSAQTIRAKVQGGSLDINPFYEHQNRAHGRSYGLSACGYDVRLAENLILCPFWGRLGSIIEYMALPDDVCAEVKDKSTNARMFITVQNTIIEPGWCGYLTVELTRHLPWPVVIKAGTPIAQIVFKELDQPTDRPYVGKYNNQPPVPVKAKMEESG